jgi:hypothetical protein
VAPLSSRQSNRLVDERHMHTKRARQQPRPPSYATNGISYRPIAAPPRSPPRTIGEREPPRGVRSLTAMGTPRSRARTWSRIRPGSAISPKVPRGICRTMRPSVRGSQRSITAPPRMTAMPIPPRMLPRLSSLDRVASRLLSMIDALVCGSLVMTSPARCRRNGFNETSGRVLAIASAYPAPFWALKKG